MVCHKLFRNWRISFKSFSAILPIRCVFVTERLKNKYLGANMPLKFKPKIAGLALDNILFREDMSYWEHMQEHIAKLVTKIYAK